LQVALGAERSRVGVLASPIRVLVIVPAIMVDVDVEVAAGA